MDVFGGGDIYIYVFCSPRLDIHVVLFSFWIHVNKCVRSVSFQLLNG